MAQSKNTFSDWISEADTDELISEVEQMLKSETYVSRTTGKLYKSNPDSGDGYWCAVHEGYCSRSCNQRRWGKFGAAGVLFYHRETQTFLMNQRSKAIHHGGTYSTLGGALDRDEDTFDGAMREVEEEIGMVPVSYWQLVSHEDVTEGEHSDWTYTTFVVEVEEQWEPQDGDWESMGNDWMSLSEMSAAKLHPSFRANVHTLLKSMYYEGAFNG